ncbi:MAG: hypothetical protein NUV47_01330 [Patescibacteria group bacterium]|nr:hypothetical protein [Patescibacteria group bacterium]
MNKQEIDFLDFVKKFDKKEKAKDYAYYSTDFLGIYDIDKDEKGNYQIVNLNDFFVVCELPAWLNQLFLRVENTSKYEVQTAVKTAIGID